MVEVDGFIPSRNISNLEFKELKDKIECGDPTKEDMARYQKLIESGQIDDDLINKQAVEDDFELQPEAITRWEHEDRPSDDRLRQLSYDGAEEPDWIPEFSIGTSVTYAGDNFKWLGLVIQGKKPVFIPDSPFIKGDKEANAKIYQYLRQCVDYRRFERVEGVKGGRLLNYLTCYVTVPSCLKLKESARGKYLKFFLFGKVVERYREAVFTKHPNLRGAKTNFQELPKGSRLKKHFLLESLS